MAGIISPNAITGAINMAMQVARAGVQFVAKSGITQKLFTAVANGMPSVIQMGVEAIKKGGEFFSQLAGGNLFSIGTTIVQKVADTVKNILPNISLLRNIDFSQILQSGFSLLNRGSGQESTLSNLLKDFALELGNPINIVSSLAGKIRDKLGNLNLLDSITKVNTDEINIFWGILSEKFQNIQGRFQEFLGNLGILNEDGTNGRLSGIIEQLKSTVSGFTDKIPGFNEFLNKVTGGAYQADKTAKEKVTTADGHEFTVHENEYGKWLTVSEDTPWYFRDADGNIAGRVTAVEDDGDVHVDMADGSRILYDKDQWDSMGFILDDPGKETNRETIKKNSGLSLLDSFKDNVGGLFGFNKNTSESPSGGQPNGGPVNNGGGSVTPKMSNLKADGSYGGKSTSCVTGAQNMAKDVYGDRWTRYSANAKDMGTVYASHGYNVSYEPSDGAVMCMSNQHPYAQADSNPNGGSVYGHSGMVKKKYSDGSIDVAQTGSSKAVVRMYPDDSHGAMYNYTRNGTTFITPPTEGKM